jgi:hypothetical protein
VGKVMLGVSGEKGHKVCKEFTVRTSRARTNYGIRIEVNP